jgi:hypothetical protein
MANATGSRVRQRVRPAIAIEQALAGYQGASSALAAACDRVTECSQEAAEVAAVVRNLAPASVEYKNLYLFQDVLARGRWRNPLRLQAWPSFGSD